MCVAFLDWNLWCMIYFYILAPPSLISPSNGENAIPKVSAGSCYTRHRTKSFYGTSKSNGNCSNQIKSRKAASTPSSRWRTNRSPKFGGTSSTPKSGVVSHITPPSASRSSNHSSLLHKSMSSSNTPSTSGSPSGTTASGSNSSSLLRESIPPNNTTSSSSVSAPVLQCVSGSANDQEDFDTELFHSSDAENSKINGVFGLFLNLLVQFCRYNCWVSCITWGPQYAEEACETSWCDW